MPFSWWFVVREGCLYISGKSDPVVAIQASKGQPNAIKVKFFADSKPRLLILDNFNNDTNTISAKFKGCTDGVSFVAKWKDQIEPFLSDAGEYNEAVECESRSEPSPINGQKRKSTLCKELLPATKIAKQSLLSECDDEASLDKAIREHFLGFFMLPVMLLSEPSESSLVREKDEAFVARLKREMIDNPISDVQPILCIVNLPEGAAFQPSLKEAYTYKSIGGNHSREALQQLLKENPTLKENKVFSHKLCSVYSDMDSKLIRRLASKHNRATSFSHSTTTWDRVIECRKLLFEMSHTTFTEDADPPSKKPSKWKSFCAAILSQKVEQLDDAMVFYLATMKASTFSLIQTIFDEYSKGLLKGQKVPKSKKSMAKVLELKGSNFKCLRGIESSVVESLLTEMSEGGLSFSELQSQCQTIKQLGKIQSAFMKATNCETWDEACEKYTQFTSSEKLEPFKKLNFNNPTIPEEFMKYCQLAMKKQADDTGATKSYDGDTIFVFDHSSAVGLFWRSDVLEASADSLDVVFKNAWGAKEVKQLSLLVRALNYGVGKQQYTVVFVTKLEEISSITTSLADQDGDTLQTGVCVLLNEGKKGQGDCAHGLVLLFAGGCPASESQVYICDQDKPYLDDSKPLHTTQKPTALFSKLIELYTIVGDWILDGTGGIGTSMIAALSAGRNCVCIENDPVLFIHSKINVIDVLNKRTQEVESAETAEET